MKKTHKKPIAFLAVFLFTTTLLAQTATFEWAKGYGSSGYDIGTSITTDANGNVYAVGGFSGTIDFDPGTGVSNLSAAGATDVYIQKTDVMGELIWAKRIGGSSNDFGKSITYDGNGNIVMAGYFKFTVDFDPGAGTNNITALGSSYETFVLKLDTSGNFLWAKSLGSTSDDFPRFLTTDANGNVYTTGEFIGTADFDPGTGTTNLVSNGSEDIFIQKLDANGDFLWAKSMGGTGTDRGYGITVDPNGNVYTVGEFSGSVDFDPGAGTTNFTSNGASDIFIQKLDAAGDFIWGKNIGGADSDNALATASDALGNVYITGGFQGSVDFDPGTGNSILVSAGSVDMFLQKLDANGNSIWLKQMGGTSVDQPSSLYLDDLGGLYTTGRYYATADFNPGPGITNLITVGGSDIFIQKMDTSGAFHWAFGMGGSDNESGSTITTDLYGNVYTTGHFKSTADFEPGAGTTNLTAVNDYDVFVHKMSQCFMTTGVDVITACDAYTWIDGNTYTASNNTAKDTIMNAAGCDSVVALDLTIYSVSDITTSLAGITITANNTAATYVWLDCDNNNAVITGETNQTFTPTNNGNYAVELTENGCVDTSDCVTVEGLGVITNSLSNRISVFPNPTENSFSILVSEPQELLNIRILSISGQVILSERFQNTNIIELELKQPSGIYFLEVTNNKGDKEVFKLVKK